MMSWNTTIVLLLLSFSAISIVSNAERCCKFGIIRNYSTCENGQKILPKCDGSNAFLNNAWAYASHYKILNDSVGEYVENFELGYIVRSPYFCVGEKQRRYTANKSDPVAIFCIPHREYYRDLNITIDDSDNEEYFLTYISILNIFLNILSSLLYAVAFYVYYLVLPARQIEDDCLLNFAASWTLAHVSCVYHGFNTEGVLPNMCITSLYFLYYFAISGFTYYALFMYYLWKKYKIGASLEEAAVLKQFRIIGYGTPACLMILINIHAHASKLYSEYKFETDCTTHQILIEDIYIFGPLILTIGFNCYFWKSLEKHLETRAIKTTEDDFNKKKINSLLMLNKRLFVALGLPWLAYIIISGSYEIYENPVFGFFGMMTNLSTSAVGAFVALILVMSRGKVWKSVVLKYENYEWLKNWQPSDPAEISTLTDNGSVEFSGAYP